MDTMHAPDDMPLSDTVFERTDRGRLVALKKDNGLSGEAQRLLLMMRALLCQGLKKRPRLRPGWPPSIFGGR